VLGPLMRLMRNSAVSTGQPDTALSIRSLNTSIGLLRSRVFRGRPSDVSATRSGSACEGHGQVRSLGEVLPEQTVRVLVAAPLPGRVRVAEEHVQARGHGEIGVPGRLLALVPRQVPPS
jgi:hypothetical protein